MYVCNVEVCARTDETRTNNQHIQIYYIQTYSFTRKSQSYIIGCSIEEERFVFLIIIRYYRVKVVVQ